jgi:RimJ/RimL family protein N-acetyltransferase
VNRIATERLVLEPVTPHNAVTLWRIMQSAHLREFQDIPRHAREEFERRVASRPKRLDARAVGRFEWLIVVASTHQAIGWVSLRVAERVGSSAELGYSLLAGYRGSGYASEAVIALVDYAFEQTGLRHLEACCLPANTPSRKLLARAGFDEIRIQINGAMVRGRPVDIVCFELTRNLWLERREATLAYASSANTIVTPESANPK